MKMKKVNEAPPITGVLPGIVLVIFSLVSFLLLAGCSSWQKVSNPNLIVIIVDTLRADRLGCYGYHKIKTQNIDRIAREGLLFTEAVSQVPLTLPSHCTIFTGRYPTAHGVRHNGLFKLNQDEITLAEVLKENGFETAAFVGSYILNSGFGLEQGFKTYNDVKIELKSASEMKSVQEIKGPERVAEQVNEEFFKWLPAVRGKRFFAWIHYYDPHYPYVPPADTSKKLEGEGYDQEISYSDQCIGDLLEKLEEKGVLDNSILVFTSDHGESLGEHGENAHGIFIYDCTIRIPFILRAPWMAKGGSRYNGLFETVDIMPTLLGLLNISIPPSAQGKSFAEEINGRKYREGKSESYAETYMPTFEYGWSELKSIRSGEKKYIEAPIPELYHLTKDPGELINLYDSADEECKRMKDSLAALVSKISTSNSGSFEFEKPDEEEIKILKSLGYLSGDYFRGGKIEPGQERVDPKLTIEEENIITNGKNLMAEGKFAEAIAAFKRVLQKNPKNYQARIFIIKILIAMGDFGKAMLEAEDAIRIAELDHTAMYALGAELWNMYGFLLEKKKDDEGAIRAYLKGFEINPNAEIAFTFPTNYYITRKDFDRALDIVMKALKENPDNIVANSYLFKLQIEKKNVTEASETARKLVRYDLTEDAPTLALVAQILYDMKALPEAASAYEQILKVNPKDKNAAGILGGIYIAIGEPRKAREKFEYVLTLDSDEFRAHFYLGVIDLQKNDEASARNRFKKVLSINPTYYPVHDALGSWLKEKGRLEEAREEFQRAITLNPEDPVAFDALRSLQQSLMDRDR
ncbi:MAG: sulfatase-like hydrolase/transferase [Acidobacteriota bacterium]